MPQEPGRTVLVTGASITGTAAAWWLHKFGWRVTVVERAATFRDGGQNIDVRGVGRDVLRRMGLEGAVRAAGTGERGMALIDGAGRVRAAFMQEDFSNGLTAELEILRGDLARLFYDQTADTSEYIFGDSIAALDEDADGVEVTFRSGGRRRFDLVLVAEGIGSATRRLVFGEGGRRPFDLYTAYFTIPRGKSDSDVARIYNAPGGRIVTVRPDRKGTTRALLSLYQKPDGTERLPAEEQKRILADRFAGAGWETPRILEGLRNSTDFYFESIGQIRIDQWHKGRVGLVGDAAYAPSPISGKGTTLGIVGAYVLAGELSRADRPAEGLAAYERIMRPYVEQIQNVPKWQPRLMHQQTRLGIRVLHKAAALMTTRLAMRLASRMTPPADKIDLPIYDAPLLPTPG